LLGGQCQAGAIWSMHFIGMLAIQAPVAIRYALATTVLSLLVALAASHLAVDDKGQPPPRQSPPFLAAPHNGRG
ncbi:MHYT domain-containing protein, partial [Pseudomonas sihuiensis]